MWNERTSIIRQYRRIERTCCKNNITGKETIVVYFTILIVITRDNNLTLEKRLSAWWFGFSDRLPFSRLTHKKFFTAGACLEPL
jgi:hypothetical protein